MEGCWSPKAPPIPLSSLIIHRNKAFDKVSVFRKVLDSLPMTLLAGRETDQAPYLLVVGPPTRRIVSVSSDHDILLECGNSRVPSIELTS